MKNAEDLGFVTGHGFSRALEFLHIWVEAEDVLYIRKANWLIFGIGEAALGAVFGLCIRARLQSCRKGQKENWACLAAASIAPAVAHPARSA